jgi:NADH-quinone oxidoreductase subunit M
LIIWAFWIGLYPKPFFKVLERPVTAIVERVDPRFFNAAAAPNPAGSAGVSPAGGQDGRAPRPALDSVGAAVQASGEAH